MIAKLLGVADRISSVDLASYREPVSLTDAQLDMVAGGFAQVSVTAINANAQGMFQLGDSPSGSFALVFADFTAVGDGPHTGDVSAQVGPNS
jgi:hypothetical protein